MLHTFVKKMLENSSRKFIFHCKWENITFIKKSNISKDVITNLSSFKFHLQILLKLLLTVCCGLIR